jgi:hypothetical protein
MVMPVVPAVAASVSLDVNNAEIVWIEVYHIEVDELLGRLFEKHESVNHSIGEYVRGDAHTNTIEGYFSILKRGIHGVYHHVSQQHLKRYLAEFDFRYNERAALGVDDATRADRLVRGIVGKRLMYRDSSAAGNRGVL